MSDKTERARRRWDKHAPRYDREMEFWERRLLKESRPWACGQASGDVLEIAVGTGRNLSFYPKGVRLTAIELSPRMLQIARARAHELSLDVDLREGDAQALELPDARFDTVVCTFSLCSIPDDRGAVAEAFRVLRPGGLFVLAEHVRSPHPAVRIGQFILEPIARLQGDTLLRDQVSNVRSAGFQIEHLKRGKWGIVEHLAARKPLN